MSRTFVLFFLLAYARLFAQTPGASTLLSVNEGLSQGMVFDILQTRDGYLWIATKDGLNRYDGYRFKVFAPDAFDPFSIAVSETNSLFEDSRGRIWVSYWEGIDVFLPASQRFFHLSPKVSGNKAITESQDGTIWLVSNNELWKIEAGESFWQKAAASSQSTLQIEYSKIEIPPREPSSNLGGKSATETKFYSVFFTKDQRLFATTSDGLYRIDRSAGKPQLEPEGLPGSDLLYILGEDSSGWLWLRSSETMWVWKGKSEPLTKIPTLFSTYWQFDRKGNLWELEGNTLRKWRPSELDGGRKPLLETICTAPVALSENLYFTRFTIDQSGNAWIGTSGYGMLKVIPAKPKFLSYLPGQTQWMIAEEPTGNLFTTHDPKKLYGGRQFSQSKPNPWLSRFSPILNCGIYVFDKKGNCWVNSFDNTLFRIDARTKEPKSFKGNGIGLLYSKKGKLLTVSEKALLEFDPETEEIIAHPFEKPYKFNNNPTSFLNYFFEDSEGTVWIYAFWGLLKAMPAGTGYRFEYFENNPEDRSSLSNNFVFSVAEDPLEPGKYLWVDTKGGGLNRLDLQTGKFRHYKTEQGLPDNVVYGILPDNDGNIWLSTNKGLCRFNVRDGKTKNFTVADGLQSNEFNQGSFLKTSDGTMIFGGVNGVTVFHPDSLRFNEHKPQIAITGIWVNNQPVGVRPPVEQNSSPLFLKQTKERTSHIELAHDQNLLLLEFAALDFTNPAQNLYRYQLVGVDKDWVELGTKNSVQFANLQPGSYTFKVLGSNNDGIWSEQPAVLEFTIRPPWWAAWWAYLFYALAIGAGIWLFYRYQLRQKLEHQETLRLRELDEFKNRFFTNITHEFRTPLTVILGTAEQVETKVGKEFKPKLGLIRRNGQNLLRLINQLLDLAKLESNTLKLNYVQGDVLSYLRYIAESLHSFANAQNVMLRVESKEREIIMDYDPERLLQIVYNLLSNAVKFTPSGGRVTLSIGMRNEGRGMKSGGTSSLIPHSSSLYLSVTDTGVGIRSEDLPYIFDRFFQANNLEKAKAGGTGIGLSLTKELVKAMGGDISVESEVGKGTTFTVRLPITQSPLTPKGEPQLPHSAEIFEKVTPELPGVGSPLGVRGESSEGSPSILLIEDNPDVVEYLAACLNSPTFGGGRGEAYQLDFAYNGRAGIEKALETIPDLIISDVMMPEKDGFEVCESLKNDERTSHIPIVLLTAKAGVENRIAGLKKGADAYLSKPFHQEELLVTLANLLEIRRKLQVKYSTMDLTPAPLIPHPSSLIPDPEDAFLQKVKTAILERLSDSGFTVEDLSRALAMSHPQLHRKLAALTGKGPAALIRSMRLARAKELLLKREMNVSEVAFEVGFDDPKYFSRVFTEEFGIPPSKI